MNIWNSRWEKKVTITNESGYIESLEGLSRTQKLRKGAFSFSAWAEALSSPALRHGRHSWSSCFQNQTVLTPSAPSFSGFGLRLNYTAGMPASPARRRQAVGLVGLCNHKSQIPQELSAYVSCWFCFPGEPWLVHFSTFFFSFSWATHDNWILHSWHRYMHEPKIL